MSERKVSSGDYPATEYIEIDGQLVEIYNTNNLFSYIASTLRIRENEAIGKNHDNVVDMAVATSPLRPYFEQFIDEDGEINREVVRRAMMRNRHHALLYGRDSSLKNVDDYQAWTDENITTDEFKKLMSDAFEIMAPIVEADGVRPIELTI